MHRAIHPVDYEVMDRFEYVGYQRRPESFLYPSWCTARFVA
jgi:hypothetical protein